MGFTEFTRSLYEMWIVVVRFERRLVSSGDAASSLPGRFRRFIGVKIARQNIRRRRAAVKIALLSSIV